MTNRSQTNHSNHLGFGTRLGHIVHDVFVGLDALTRVQYDRPWERTAHDARRRPSGQQPVRH